LDEAVIPTSRVLGPERKTSWQYLRGTSSCPPKLWKMVQQWGCKPNTKELEVI